MNMLDLNSKFLNEIKDLNGLTLIEMKTKFIFCLLNQIESSIKKVND
jgi:hypothetical protein